MNETETKLYNRIVADLNKDKEYIKLNKKMQSFRPTDVRCAGKGAKEVIDYLGTTTGDFQMDIAETNDELRIKVESLVKMIKR